MDRKPHVLRVSLLILLILAIVPALLCAVGLPMWAAREKTVSEIPEQGTYICEELSVALTFGDRTILTLPDGAILETAIDHGRRMIGLHEGTDALEGAYEAHLERYIEIVFDVLPIPFAPDRVYRFIEYSN